MIPSRSIDGLEVAATSSILIADLAQNRINLGEVTGSITFGVAGRATRVGDDGAVRFTMAGTDDVLTTGAKVVISAFDNGELANALIDIAGEIESTAPTVPAPPDTPAPGNDIGDLGRLDAGVRALSAAAAR